MCVCVCVCVCACVCVCVCGGGEASWWGLRKEFCTLLGSWEGGWGTGNIIFDFFGRHFVDFYLLLSKYLSNYFYLTKVEKFFGGDKIIHDFLCLKPCCLLF